ncbi:MAG TPA: universal stress protein [Solirubrobacterales bacterium]|nr:universal stress protein [Solirubrobacterales bacterium]
MPTSEEKGGDAPEATVAHTPHYETGPIVVGSDGSPGGDDAVALAHDLAGTSSRKLIAENIPGVVAPSIGLIGLVEREDAGTLVVGSPHRGRVGRALLGSVAHHVLHHSPCEVCVAPRGYAGRERAEKIRKIGVAYDGTPESRTALRRAEALARDTGASLHLIVAEDPVVAGIEGGEEFTPLTNAPAVLKEAVASVASSIEADGETLEPGWRQGDKSVAEAIAAACERDVDVLVAGSRKPLDRLLLGSVTGHLIDHAPCAVLVVPHEEEG